jgi:uroporphyrinogen decarboxylase
LTPRERVKAALERREGDRVPFDLGSFHDAALTLQTHREIAEALGEPFEGYHLYDWTLGMVLPDDRLLERFHVDTRNIRSGPGRHRDLESFYREVGVKELPNGDLGWYGDDGKTLVYVKPAGAYGFQPAREISRPLAGELTREKIDAAFPMPTAEAMAKFGADTEALARSAERRHAASDYAVVGNFNTVPFLQLCDMAGVEDLFADIGLCPELVRYAGEKLVEAHLPYIETWFGLLGPHIDVAYCVGDDMADQRGPSIGIDTYRKLFKPLHERVIAAVRRRTAAKVMFHICGSAHDFIPDLIGMGVDAINPVQTTAARMEPERLKREFGRDIAFWGAIDTQDVLPFGTRQQVVDEVKRKLEVLGRGGGYVFAPCHNIQVGTPGKNIVAMYETAWEFCS